MVKIAIKGHPTRGEEVIKILESLGGKNNALFIGVDDFWYFINSDRHIRNDYQDILIKAGFKTYTLEEFEREFPFKIGDKVITTDGTIGIIDRINPKDSHPYVIKTDVGNCYWCETSILKPYKEMKEERNIKLTFEKAKEWYSKGGELREIALQAFTDKELNPLPRSWEEFCEKYPVKLGETYVDGSSRFITSSSRTRHFLHGKNICPSKKSAEAHLAMIQLEQLRDCWRQGWEPIWDRSEKWCIRVWGNELSIGITTNISRFLTFPTREMAEEFLKCFRDLIEKVGDLI